MSPSPSHILELTRALFRQEADDLLAELDSALLALEAAPNDAQSIHRAFRSIHTLKGSGGTAGFHEVSALLHEVENIFGEAREGRIKIVSDMIDVMLRVADVVRQMTFGSQENGPRLLAEGKKLVAELQSVLGPGCSTTGSHGSASAEAEEADETPSSGIFRIRFAPSPQIFQTCNDPVLLMREIQLLGAATVRCNIDRLIAESDFNPELCYLSWEIQIATTATSRKIRDVFAFVEDAADLRIDPIAPESAWVLPASAYFEESVLRDFREEAHERVTEIETKVLVLEDRPDDAGCFDALRRSLHDLKGISGLLLGDARRPPPEHHPVRGISELCHATETFLECLGNQGAAQSEPRSLEVLLETADWLGILLRACDEGAEQWPTTLLEKLGGPRSPDHADKEAAERFEVSPRAAKASSTVHLPPIVTAVVGAEQRPAPLVVQGDSLSPSTTPSARCRARTVSLRATKPPADRCPPQQQAPLSPTEQRSVRVDQAKLDRLMRAVDELLVAKNALPVFAERVRSAERSVLGKDIKELGDRIAHIVNDLQDTTRQIRMMPIRTVFQRFPRMIRDLARSANKQVQLILSGEETELDKTVLEQISNPLVHLVRNAVDHGIETPAERLAKNKPEMGTVGLEVIKEGSQIILHISDDGRGMDPERLRRKAVENGLLPEAEAAGLPTERVLDLIFLPGFSTAEKVTDISGRGVGMDAVQSSVRQLHGSISIVSRVGQGSMFSIKLPSSLMVSKGILFECGGQPYVLPAEGIRQMEKVRLDRIRQFQDVSVASIRGTLYPVFWLTRLLGLVPTHDADHVSRDDEVNAVILSTPGGEVAVIVDRFVAQVEVVVKPLSEGLNSLLIFQGATILGDGRVALVLDPTQLETAVDTTRSTTCGNLERAAG